MRRGHVQFVWVEANTAKSEFCSQKLDGILRTTTLLFLRFFFSFGLEELSSCHTHKTLPHSSEDDNSEEALITA